MIRYRLAIKVGNKHVQIYRGEVSDKGDITIPLPKDAAPGGVIVIEWEHTDE